MLLVLLVALALQATSLTCTVIMRYTAYHGDAEVERIGMVNLRLGVSKVGGNGYLSTPIQTSYFKMM